MAVAVAEVLAAPRVAGGGVGELAAAAERRRGLWWACAVAGRLVGCWADAAVTVGALLLLQCWAGSGPLCGLPHPPSDPGQH